MQEVSYNLKGKDKQDMMNLIFQSGRKAYGVNHYVIDTEDEVSNLPTDCAMGSAATVIATGNNYILNGQKAWVKQPESSSSSSSGSEGEIIELNTSADDGIIVL